ncbi:hypothetical protein SEA_CRICKO_43 [Streptomyces phage CricKo]|nr:hypothetical protein SEA_RAINYDAI_42 [Streptomyces phage Rainydai]AWN06144.1 hypothetical protein SEA_SENDITCS_41 [Streptomyces phage SendItCS]QJD49926.1 hypothetical protein SEA_CRICKO_43 [Streptomyces phage CricKo]QNL30658.1 membrane protein [Streptomyces phage Thiqqums]WIC89379.1 membrane protein [Streptomyces phage Miek]
MDLSALFQRAGKVAAKNSPAILSAIGVTGTITTAYLAAKGAFRAKEILDEAQTEKDDEARKTYLEEHPNESAVDPYLETPEAELTNQEKFELTWQCYVPAAISAAVGISAIIFAAHVNERRNAALMSAYSVVEKSYGEYRAKTLAKVGKNKEQAIRDEINQDRVTENPPGKNELIIITEGNVPCRDSFSGRYFDTNMQALRKVENDINWEILNNGYASLSDVWDKLGLQHTTGSDDIGWNTDRQFELKVTTTVTTDDRPCFSIEFMPPPIPRYWNATG